MRLTASAITVDPQPNTGVVRMIDVQPVRPLNGEQTVCVMTQLGFLRDHILTIVAASIPNKGQCDAIKELVNAGFSRYEPQMLLAQPVAQSTSGSYDPHRPWLGLEWNVVEHAELRGQWHVEAIGADGECYVTMFTGPDAQSRAREFAAWANNQ